MSGGNARKQWHVNVMKPEGARAGILCGDVVGSLGRRMKRAIEKSVCPANLASRACVGRRMYGRTCRNAAKASVVKRQAYSATAEQASSSAAQMMCHESVVGDDAVLQAGRARSA